MHDEPHVSKVVCKLAMGHDRRCTKMIIEKFNALQAHWAAQATTERLPNRLLARKAFGKVGHSPIGRAHAAAELGRKPLPLGGPKDALCKPHAPAIQHGPHALNEDQIGADPNNHRAASRIRRFISRTASRMPTKTARETIECPMWSSRTPSSAATGWTLK